MKIEKVTVEDAEELLEIYAPYVENTAIVIKPPTPIAHISEIFSVIATPKLDIAPCKVWIAN